MSSIEATDSSATPNIPEDQSRYSLTVDSDINETKPHPELWFDDGSLVILTSSVRFRIYRGTLSRQSVIFNDMMALPDDTETFQGCRVVRLPDLSEDVTVLLRALYYPDGLKLDLGPQGNVFKLLRISTKYEFTALRKKAIEVVEYHNPTTLDGFRARCGSFVVAGREAEIIDETKLLSDIIDAATACNLPQFLPVALYRLSCLPAPNGSQDGLIMAALSDGRMLSWCFSGRTRIQHTKIDYTPSPRCNIPSPKPLVCRGAPDVISGRFIFSEVQWEQTLACYKCTVDAKGLYYAAQQKVWDLLPEYFGHLGKSWAQLRADSEA